jgi:hypothetical protein
MKQDPKVARALRAARKCYADGGDVTTADVRRKLADQVTNRGTILPFADYADGSTRLAWPGILYEPAAAWRRMVDEGPTAEDSFTVASAVPIAGLAAAAVRPGASLGSGGGRLVKGDMPTYKGYHGTSDANYFVTKELVPNRMWMTGSRDDAAKAVANSYADRHYTGNPSAVIPVEGRFENPMIVDARGARWKEIPFEDTRLTADDLASEAVKRGHDGLVVENVKDQMVSYGSEPTIRTIAALRPGTVFDDFGNQLFSNSSKAATPGLAAVEANRVAKSLPMDEASRMARAREMGFDTDTTWYHGTKSPNFESFDLKKAGKSDPGLVGKAVYFTPEAEQAGSFAASQHYGKGDAPAVIPAYLRMQNPAYITDGVLPDGRRLTDVHPSGITKQSAGAINRALKAAGHDGVIFRTGDGELMQAAVFDPSRIRSPRAAFDPDQIDSANLLAANSSKASTPGLAALESNRVRGSLPMDEASRLARARELGFDVDKPIYHGTYANFDEFQLGKPGASAEAGRPGLSNDYLTFAGDRRHAAEYGDVGQYYVRGKIYEHDAVPDIEHAAKSSGYGSAQEYIDASGSFYAGTGLDDILRDQATAARRAGYDGVRLKFGDLEGSGFSRSIGGDVYAMFDPKNIRSTQAAFDPARSDSANLLAANPSTASINALIAALLQSRQSEE